MSNYHSAQTYWLRNWKQVKTEQFQLNLEWNPLKMLECGAGIPFRP